MLAAGTGFLLAAAVQLSLLAGASGGLLGGNASTSSLWLGLGVGLIAIGMVPRPETAPEYPRKLTECLPRAPRAAYRQESSSGQRSCAPKAEPDCPYDRVGKEFFAGGGESLFRRRF